MAEPATFTLAEVVAGVGGLGAIALGAWAAIKNVAGEGWGWKKQRHEEQRDDRQFAIDFLKEQNATLQQQVDSYEPRMKALKERADKMHDEIYALKIKNNDMLIEIANLQAERQRDKKKIEEQGNIIASQRQRLEKC